MTTVVSPQPFAGRRALVGFSGEARVWWLKVLKPEFRHVSVAIEDGAGGFVFYNPMLSASEIVRVVGPEKIIREKMENTGFLVVPTKTREIPKKPLAIRPYNCVEGVKRALGINAPWVFTPWQLYKILVKKANKKENNP